jgi:hypothetical protein
MSKKSDEYRMINTKQPAFTAKFQAAPALKEVPMVIQGMRQTQSREVLNSNQS